MNQRVVLILYNSFMAHPEIMLQLPEIDDPVQRFVSVVKFYLSGWHIKPPYVHCNQGTDRPSHRTEATDMLSVASRSP